MPLSKQNGLGASVAGGSFVQRSTARRPRDTPGVSHGWRALADLLPDDDRSNRSSGPSQAGLAGLDDGVAAVGEMQLGEDGGDVVGDRLRGQVETRSDLGVTEARSHGVEDLALAFRELGEGSVPPYG